MRSESTRHLACIITFALLIAVLSTGCQDRIIERSSYKYYPLDEGNWWRYSDNSLYDPQSVIIEVESLDTLLEKECYSVSISGNVVYYTETDRGVSEYAHITYTFSGSEYTIVEGFVDWLELPMVSGNQWKDSVCGNLSISGNDIHAKHIVDVLVSEYTVEELYGSVYKVVRTISDIVVSPDSTVETIYTTEEYYAPNIGLIRFHNQEGEFSLVEYEIQ
jgi:hypothetical protein